MQTGRTSDHPSEGLGWRDEQIQQEHQATAAFPLAKKGWLDIDKNKEQGPVLALPLLAIINPQTVNL